MGDIGGTNARFALLESDRVGRIESVPVANYERVNDAIEALFDRHFDRASISGAMLAVAGPVENGRVKMTNSPWVIDADELRKTFGWNVCVINDFEAIAWSLPHLAPSDLRLVGRGQAVPTAPAVVLGPGTGLGLACLVPRPDVAIVLESEGGHTTLPGGTSREDAIIAHLRERFNHASAERALSGDGLVNLYEAICSIERLQIKKRSAAEITAAALESTCPISIEALDMFCAMLGTVAGNAALTFAARGGVYVAGGIAPRIVDFLVNSPFRRRFEAKGRFGAYLSRIPTAVIIHSHPSFVGLQCLARQKFRQ
nr:glucokinase [Hyphomicrobium sp. 99]